MSYPPPLAVDFAYLWRTVRLYCPSAPTFLAREWVQVAWKQMSHARRWGWLRQAITVTCDGINPLVLLPPDFGSFEVLVDQARQCKISFTHSLDQLLSVDPGLTATGPPAALIAVARSLDPATLHQAQYRVYPNGPATLTGYYYPMRGRLTDTDTIFGGVPVDFPEVLVAGALAQAALWPGTGDKPNPYFNAGIAQAKAEEFRIGIQMLSLRDDEQYPDDLWDSWPYADMGIAGNPDLRASDWPAPVYPGSIAW